MEKGLVCFNPCYFGLAIQATSIEVYCNNIPWFQSLLFWISHLGNAEKAEKYSSAVFQSLLFWISHLGDPEEYDIGWAEYVSILVILDQPFRLVDGRPVAWFRARFQSLLFWISHLGPERPIQPNAPERRFNPCYFGLAIQANIFAGRERIQACVSILVILDQPFRPC